MFRIQPVACEQWSIVDERDESVFVGTLGQCEDWLDFYENHQRREKVGLFRWWSLIRNLFRTEALAKPPNDHGDKADGSGPVRDPVQ